MIPKIVHFTWFSGEEMPQTVKDCIASWKRILPSYELRLWDMEAVRDIDSIFLKEALSLKKWAYAADYIRLYALYNEGGIYLDTDVVVFKNFDEFLYHDCFIGREDYMRFENFGGVQYLASHCIGAVKGHIFIKDCLEYYKDRHFEISQNQNLPTLLRYNYVLIPYIQAVIALKYGYEWDPRKERIQKCRDGLVIYPKEYFDGLPQRDSLYCQHLALGSWRENYSKQEKSNVLNSKIMLRLKKSIKSFLLQRSIVIMKITV